MKRFNNRIWESLVAGNSFSDNPSQGLILQTFDELVMQIWQNEAGVALCEI